MYKIMYCTAIKVKKKIDHNIIRRLKNIFILFYLKKIRAC